MRFLQGSHGLGAWGFRVPGLGLSVQAFGTASYIPWQAQSQERSVCIRPSKRHSWLDGVLLALPNILNIESPTFPA